MSGSRFLEMLENSINGNSEENGSNTPDFILAEFMADALKAFERASLARERWYNCHHAPGFRGTFPPSPEPAPQDPGSAYWKAKAEETAKALAKAHVEVKRLTGLVYSDAAFGEELRQAQASARKWQEKAMELANRADDSDRLEGLMP